MNLDIMKDGERSESGRKIIVSVFISRKPPTITGNSGDGLESSRIRVSVFNWGFVTRCLVVVLVT